MQIYVKSGILYFDNNIGVKKMDDARIKNQVKKLGISPAMKGYTYLYRAVQLVYDDGEHFFGSADELYTVIARENGTNAHCIERDIRTAIRDSRCNISVKKLIFMIAESLSSEELWE